MKKRDNFAKWYASGITAFGCLYITLYTFIPMASKSEDSKMILGFVMGTLLGTAVTWSIGTSKTSADKDNRKGDSDVQET